MRLIDADALKELFSEVIGSIAKKPEMNGNLEHMIRASAMVIQMIDDAPTVQPYTTTHDSIPAETGKNDGDRTSGDCIGRTQAIDALRNYLVEKRCPDDGTLTCRLIENEVINKLPSAQPETNCSEIPNNSDTISRQAAIEPEAISKWKKEFREYVDSLDIARDDWKGIIEYIDELPSVQPERKTGHWIKTARWGRVYYCDQCRNYLDFDGVNAGRGSTNFCPNCGAKMERRQDGH